MALAIFGTIYLCTATYVGYNKQLKGESKTFFFVIMTIILILFCLFGA